MPQENPDPENQAGKFDPPPGLSEREQAAYRLGILNFMLYILGGGVLPEPEEGENVPLELARERRQRMEKLKIDETDGEVIGEEWEPDLAAADMILEEEAMYGAFDRRAWGL